MSDPVWERGKPVPFGSEQTLKKKVDKALAGIGFSNAFCIVTIESDQTTGTADLVVSIIEEGGPNVARGVKVDGLVSHSSEQILAFLDFRPNMIVNRKQITEMKLKLWKSGRFSQHDVEFDAATNLLRLRISEVDLVPTIDKPIDEYAKVFLKTRDWLTTCGENGIDVEFEYVASKDVRITVVQSLDGALMQVIDRGLGVNGSTITVLADKDAVIVDQSDHPSIYRVDSAFVDGKMHFSSTLAPPEKDGGEIRQVVGFIVNTDRMRGESFLIRSIGSDR
ncbi:MAG: hypothetical protein KDB00_14400 [Planctomycetales bacterium]|nr:hypothetical protein [Planctomycetales bacterium]